MLAELIKPGAPTPVSGQYVEVDPRGGVHDSSEVTSVSGKPMPPTSKPGCSWLLVDPTKHRR